MSGARDSDPAVQFLESGQVDLDGALVFQVLNLVVVAALLLSVDEAFQEGLREGGPGIFLVLDFSRPFPGIVPSSGSIPEERINQLILMLSISMVGSWISIVFGGGVCVLSVYLSCRMRPEGP